MQFIQIQENDSLKSRVYLHLVDATDGITAKTGQTGKAQVSVNGKTPATSNNSIVEIDSTNQPGTYYIQLSGKELKDPGFVIVRFKNASTAEFVDIVQVIAFDPYAPYYGGGGGGGDDIDYKKVRKIMQEELATLPKAEPVELPETPNIPFHLQPLLNAITGVRNDIKGINMPATDLSELASKLTAVEAAVKAVEMPQTDLSPVLDAISSLQAVMKVFSEKNKQDTATIQNLREYFTQDIETITKLVASINSTLAKMPFLLLGSPKQNQPNQQGDSQSEPIDYAKLLSQ